MESAHHAQTSRYSPITSLAKFGDRVATRTCVLLAAQGARAGPAASAAAAQIGVRAAARPRSRPGGPAGRSHTQRSPSPPPRPASVLPARARASGQAPTSSRRAVGRGGWPTPLCGVSPSEQTVLEELAGTVTPRVPFGVRTAVRTCARHGPARGLEAKTRCRGLPPARSRRAFEATGGLCALDWGGLWPPSSLAASYGGRATQPRPGPGTPPGGAGGGRSSARRTEDVRHPSLRPPAPPQRAGC